MLEWWLALPGASGQMHSNKVPVHGVHSIVVEVDSYAKILVGEAITDGSTDQLGGKCWHSWV